MHPRLTDVLAYLQPTYLAQESPERHELSRLDLVRLAEEVAGQPEAEGGAVAHVVHPYVLVLVGERLSPHTRRPHPLETHERRGKACNRVRR